MRTELLCALAFLCGAEAALAQPAPLYPYPAPAYYPGYAPAYPMAPAANGYYAYPQPGYAGYTYNPGYAYYPAQAYSNNAVYYPQYANPNLRNAFSASVSGPAPVALADPTPVQPPPSHPIAKVASSAAAAASGAAASAAAKVSTWSLFGNWTPFANWSPLLDWSALTNWSLPNGPFHREVKDTFWVSADYELSWFRTDRLPGALLTTGSPLDMNPGALNQPGTGVLFGNQIQYKTLPAFKAEAGVFLDEDDHFSVEVAGQYVQPKRLTFRVSSDASGNPIIARPFFDIATLADNKILDSFPTSFPQAPFLPESGSAEIDAKSELYGFEINARLHTYAYERLHADALLGVRYLHLGETLSIQDQVQFLPAGTQVPVFNLANVTGLSDFDSFQTSNSFYGLQVGGRVRWEQDWFFVNAYGKLAVGANQQKININGGTTFFTPLGFESTSGGVLALPSNIGNHTRTVFAVIPEGGLTIGTDVTSWLRVTLGYSFLLWNGVVRPGSEVDRASNSGQIPGSTFFGLVSGPARPQFGFNDVVFWTQTLNCGLEFHY